MIDIRTLSKTPSKIEMYDREGFIHHSIADICQLLGNDVQYFGDRFALLIIRAETFVGRRALKTINIIRNMNFSPIGWKEVEIYPLLMKELWKFQLNIASEDRVKLITEITAKGNSLIVLLRDEESGNKIPATLRLSSLKGSLSPERRHPDDIRSKLDMKGTTFGFIHTSDEPIDMFRELKIIFSTDELRELFAYFRIGSEGSEFSEIVNKIREMENYTEQHSLSFEEVVERLKISSPDCLDSIMTRIDNDFVPLSHIREVLSPLDTSAKIWDFMVLSSELIQSKRPDVVRVIIGNTGLKDLISAWEEASKDYTQDYLQTSPRPKGVGLDNG